ncbi:MAG: adenylosuccinate lyase [Dehalococcoidia bacterium]|uniref:Adenylosuccinate lyase n=1 Tax=marine metagenome TaxID=408172 RepID=A0A381QPC9_9ZZZZ|nr:adenylosuccinate lyase [Dehalococcoidia bacterium]MEC7913166.1 adenylosuccinate lyase [Chloroflexota bacterium]HAT22131.1 adenylosuccinate lyase [Dehalococcoidia bacterium]HBR65087.1 adenylosuccinate lyase [Dehalococcoidia bacterium]
MIERYSRPKMKSVWSDKNKYDKWLKIEIAVCEAWNKAGLIPEHDIVKIRKAKYDFDLFYEILDRTKHDMTAFLQSTTANLGPEGRWIHQGLTTSDVWDTATSLQLVEAAQLLDFELEQLEAALKQKAIKHKNTLMMGRTHGVHAEPITFGLKIALWWDEVKRGRKRLYEATSSISVGKLSGPVGTHATVPPSIEKDVCDLLGLSPAPVSNQIIQRDRHAHFITTLALIAATLEKIATEIRGLQRTEVREVEEPFAEGQTGSSSMPHKRNPELTERVCGLARLIRGHSITAIENVALWGERDISHSSAERVILPDSCLALDYITNLLTGVIEELRIHEDRMLENMELTRGLVFSQRTMLLLVEKGLAREDSYKIVQENSMKTWDDGLDFRELISNDRRVTDIVSPQELSELFDYSHYTKYVDDIFDKAFLS